MSRNAVSTPAGVHSDLGARSPATPLRDALGVASEHWSERPGSTVMTSMATKCVLLLEAAGYGATDLAQLKSRHGVRLLRELRDNGLSPKSVSSYYGAFRRLLELSEVSPVGWPKAPAPPRRTRDRLSEADTARIIEWLEAKGWSTTADLGRVLRGTGLRNHVEALTEARLEVRPGDDYDTLLVTGKGGHERFVPVVRADARAILKDPIRLAAMRRVSYSVHQKRWKKAVASLGVQSRLATMHAVRHGYASDVLQRSGGNLALVQELLGHANPSTTARYIQVDMAAKAKALTSGDNLE